MAHRLIYVHGWGLTADLWNPLRQRLGVMDDFAVDLGFQGGLRERIPYPAMPYVAVGHSLGLLWLLSNYPDHPWQGLISINGFSCFSKRNDFTDGWPAKVLTRMMAGLDKDPKTIYRDFMSRAGLKNPQTDHLDVERLKIGLQSLIADDGRAVLLGFQRPVLALAGGADQIVPEAMSRACFDDDILAVLDNGDHMLPISNPDWCADHIKPFLTQL